MNKKELTEADIRTKFITPALVPPSGRWDLMTQLREEIYFTKGRVIVRGKTVKRGEAKKADYLLYYKPGIPIAVIEAKDNNHAVAELAACEKSKPKLRPPLLDDVTTDSVGRLKGDQLEVSQS